MRAPPGNAECFTWRPPDSLGNPGKGAHLKVAAYIGAVLGTALLVVLGMRADLSAMSHTLVMAGWSLLWLVPYRGVYFILYAVGWHKLLQPYDPAHSAGLGYVLWVTTVREAIDRLLPVASIGGGVAGVRLLRWRGVAGVAVAATVIVEVLLTVIVLYTFTALGLLLLYSHGAPMHQSHRVVVGFLCSLPVPIVTATLLRSGSVFTRLQKALGRFAGLGSAADNAANALDRELGACLRRGASLLLAGSLQLAAWMSGALEIWLALRLFGHPTGIQTALILESMTQALRHIVFFVPGAIGVQEAGLVMFGNVLGISGDLALAISMAKRIRELLCGVPPLLSWQWLEYQRLRAGSRTAGRPP